MSNWSVILHDSLSQGSIVAIFLSWVAGVVTSFTPCVYPMIPISFSVIAESSLTESRSDVIKHVTLYFLGMILIYSSLGIFAGLSGTVLGKYSNSYIVNIVLSFVFVFWGLNMLEVFHIRYPVIEKHNISGSFSFFLMGLFSGVVYAPCGAPSLFVLLSFISLKGNLILGVTSMFFYSIGLCSLLIIVGFLSFFALSLPKPGKWMLYIKKIIGFIMIFIAISFILKMV